MPRHLELDVNRLRLTDLDADAAALVPFETGQLRRDLVEAGISALMKREPSAPLTISRNWPDASFFRERL